jgi:hypothetical protein
MASPLARSAAYRDTIGSLTYVDGIRPTRVRGYGVVVGLGTNGTTTVPRALHGRLVQDLYKQHNFSNPVVGSKTITPEQLLNDADTAVVLVEGDVPAGAVEGCRFNLRVRVVPGTETKSLRGGRLYTAELRLFRPVAAGTVITGKVLAEGAGPIFFNPFSDKSAVTRASPLEGVVVGGGVVKETRTVRLVLLSPSYSRAKQIQDRLNAKFTGPDKMADAISPSFIEITIPPEYKDDTAHFLGLVRTTYLSRAPTFEALKLRALGEEMIRPDAPHSLISLALEGLGRQALPELNKLYVHEQDHVSFFAAAAGLRLGDYLAADAMSLHANNPNSEYRLRAIRALGLAKGMSGAAMTLRKLLNDDDPRIQVAAYEALLSREDPTIESYYVGDDNFQLDVIPTTREPFVYVKRNDSRRIALFGTKLRCDTPTFYRAPDGSFTLNATEQADQLTAVRVTPYGSVSPPIPAPLELPELIKFLGSDAGLEAGNITGLSLDYAAIVRAIYYLCEDKTVAADFVLEQPSALELFGPTRRAGRPETEL